MKTVLINVDELWLRGKNRKHFFRILKSQLDNRIRYFHPHKYTLQNENQRFVLKSSEHFSQDLLDNFKFVPGLHSILPVLECASEMEEIKINALKLMKEVLTEKNPITFKVTTTRSDKDLPFNSMELSRELGGLLLQNFPQLGVKIKKPELELQVRLSHGEKAYLTLEKLKGLGGLPLKTSAHGLTMISGGFDSPVASVMMATRGMHQDFIFFHAYPFVGEEVVNKIRKIVAQLGKFQSHCTLYIIPFGHIQKKIVAHCGSDEEKYRTNLFRWGMIQVANLVAKEQKMDGLITGDSLGQVASQVLSTMHLLDQSSRLPIVRPLIGMQKKPIIQKSRDFGLHDICCLTHDDACELLAPNNPVIKPDYFVWNKITTELKGLLAEDFQNAATGYRRYFYTPWGREVDSKSEV